jgi:hypothetical protein
VTLRLGLAKSAADLPSELRFLADINSVSIGNGVHWHPDIERLVAAVEDLRHPAGHGRRRWPPLVAAGLVVVTVTAGVAVSGLVGGGPRMAAKKCGTRPGDPPRGIYCVVNPCESYPDTCTLPVHSSPVSNDVRIATLRRHEVPEGRGPAAANTRTRSLDAGRSPAPATLAGSRCV